MLTPPVQVFQNLIRFINNIYQRFREYCQLTSLIRQNTKTLVK